MNFSMITPLHKLLDSVASGRCTASSSDLSHVFDAAQSNQGLAAFAAQVSHIDLLRPGQTAFAPSLFDRFAGESCHFHSSSPLIDVSYNDKLPLACLREFVSCGRIVSTWGA